MRRPEAVTVCISRCAGHGGTTREGAGHAGTRGDAFFEASREGAGDPRGNDSGPTARTRGNDSARTMTPEGG